MKDIVNFNFQCEMKCVVYTFEMFRKASQNYSQTNKLLVATLLKIGLAIYHKCVLIAAWFE